MPENVQPVADLRFFQLTKIGIQLGQIALVTSNVENDDDEFGDFDDFDDFDFEGGYSETVYY